MARIIRKGSAGVLDKRAAKFRLRMAGATSAVQQYGLQKARDGLMLNVYNTASGRYVRTGHLLDSLGADSSFLGDMARVSLQDTALYASYIEYGTGVHAMSRSALESYLNQVPSGNLVTYGRSGLAYMMPGPYILPAIWAVKYSMLAEVRRIMRDLWR